MKVMYRVSYQLPDSDYVVFVLRLNICILVVIVIIIIFILFYFFVFNPGDLYYLEYK